MLLADFEVRHTRSASPTRRVAIGEHKLPTEPLNFGSQISLGGLLLAGVVGAFTGFIADDQRDELELLLDDLANHRVVVQPKLRHRFQVDTVGLDRSHHRLVAHEGLRLLELDEKGFEHPVPQVLAASYAVREFPFRQRSETARLLQHALAWQRDVETRAANCDLLLWLTGESALSTQIRNVNDSQWARELLGFDFDDSPSKIEVMRRFRQLIRAAHPDSGGVSSEAAKRVTELSAAKKLLMSPAK